MSFPMRTGTGTPPRVQNTDPPEEALSRGLLAMATDHLEALDCQLVNAARKREYIFNFDTAEYK